jgi:DNA polymerase
VFLDYETRSLVDLRHSGLVNYARAAQPILAAWVVTDEPYPDPRQVEIRQWDYFEEGDPYPRELLALLRDPLVRKSAFNAPFEMHISAQAFEVGIDPRQWVCSMSWAYSRGFTGGLEQVGKALGLPDEWVKMSEGRKLIQRFSVPRKVSRGNPRPFFEPRDDPRPWEVFKQYNRRDVLAEVAIAKCLSPFPWTEEEHNLWVWDRQVNQRGLPVDLDFIRKAQEAITHYEENYLERLREITGLANPNSRDQLLEWVQSNGAIVDDLQSETIERALATEPPF